VAFDLCAPLLGRSLVCEAVSQRFARSSARAFAVGFAL
jgi:hypothetical protein